jgi:hypothetical protein
MPTSQPTHLHDEKRISVSSPMKHVDYIRVQVVTAVMSCQTGNVSFFETR